MRGRARLLCAAFIAVVAAAPVARAADSLSHRVAARIREVATRGPDLSAQTFIKAGGSGTVSPHFLGCFARREGPFYAVEWGTHAELQPALDGFRSSRPGQPDPFARASLAAKTGRNVAWTLRGEPPPIDAEIEALKPRFAVLEFGTNDVGMSYSPRASLFMFVDRMQALVRRLTARGVVPLVSGMTPRRHVPLIDPWLPTYDAALRALADTEAVPFIDLLAPMRALPGLGLARDGMHANSLKRGALAAPCVFTPEGLGFGYNVRNLATLRALDVTRRALSTPMPAAPPPPIDGAGRITALPFWHAPRMAQPTRTYTLSLAQPTPLRVAVFTRRGDVTRAATLRLTHAALGPVDAKRADPRMFEGTLPAGEVTVTVAGGLGRELMLALTCAAADPDCARPARPLPPPTAEKPR